MSNKTHNGNAIKPMTDFNSVFDTNGKSLTDKISTLQTSINEQLTELEESVDNLENVVSITEQRVDILTKEQTIEHSAWNRNNEIVDTSIYEIFTYDVSQFKELQISGKFQQNSPGFPFFVITDNDGKVILHYGEDEQGTTLVDFEVSIPRNAKKNFKLMYEPIVLLEIV